MDQIRSMLKEYTERTLSPWHMPGHKRRDRFGEMWDDIFHMDVTEVPGTDDLHHASGPIRASQEEAARIYGADYSHYLVNGSTGGLLAAIYASAELWKQRGLEGPIYLVAANCHKSVWNGLRLVGAETKVLLPTGDPEYGPVQSDALSEALDELEDKEQVAGCIITSPTYGGAFSPLGELHAVLHEYGIPLIVDEAHGAHLPFCSDLSWHSGLYWKAEYVVQSLHKTLPSLTQTAILHVNGEAEEAEVQKQLAVFQSSSPSYLLLASAEQAVDWADRNREALDQYVWRMRVFREDLGSSLKRLTLVDFPEDGDPTRLMLRLKDKPEDEAQGPVMYGLEMAAWLEQETGVVVELAETDALILIGTACDTEEELEHLKEALLRLEDEIKKRERRRKRAANRKARAEAELRAKAEEERKAREYEAMRKRAEESSEALVVDLDEAMAGEDPDDEEDSEITEVLKADPLPKVGDFVQRDIYVYPPGIPILRGGERVTEAALERLKKERAAGRRIYGL